MKKFDQGTVWIFAVLLAASISGLIYLVSDFVSSNARRSEDAGTNAKLPRAAEGLRKDFLDWDYLGPRGPRQWASLNERYSLCSRGERQSPVDIQTWQVDRRILPLRFDYRKLEAKAQFDGRLAVVRAYAGESSIAGLKLTAEARSWTMEKLLIRSPSEHHIKGIPYDAELQLFHYDNERRVAVVSIFVEQSASVGEAEENLAENLLNALKKSAASGQEVDLSFDYGAILPDDRQFLQYEGSATYPPCQEGVRWLLLAKPLNWPERALRSLRELLRHNVRELQRRGLAVAASPR